MPRSRARISPCSALPRRPKTSKRCSCASPKVSFLSRVLVGVLARVSVRAEGNLMQESIPMQENSSRLEALSPRELLLERVGSILQRGAFANAVIAGLALVLGLIAGLHIIPTLFGILQSVLLARYSGAADSAVAVVILLALLDVSLLLVVMIGVLAREFWALPALVLLI